MNAYIADFHVHSYFSRATSKDCKPEFYERWAQIKGVQIVGTGDFTHPNWLKELEEKLLPKEEGLFALKEEFKNNAEEYVPPACRNDIRFILTSEISCIYKKNGKTRKIHVVIFAQDFSVVKKINSILEKIGNIKSDGRPILGLDAKNLLEIVLESHALSFLVPAHIWTPHFSLFGSESGFDSIKECFEDLSKHIFAMETGLSSDPAMNWRLTSLDNINFISNSDAHSPQNLAREANIFSCETNFKAIKEALQTGKNFLGTLEFFPEEGKYHYDGHRSCKVNMSPSETISKKGICPVCGNKVTVGVMHRVELLADRKKGEKPMQGAKPFESLIPLPEIIAESENVGVKSKKVTAIYNKMLDKLGNELYILRQAPISEIEKAGFSFLSVGIKNMREGKVEVHAGYDGEYGRIKVFTEVKNDDSQLKLL